MSTDTAGHRGEPPTRPGETSQGPSEAELRAAYEAELSRITPADMMLQAAVSLLNLGARRLGLTGGPDPSESEGTAAGASAEAPASGGSGPTGGGPAGVERDFDQVRDAIDGVRALLSILERTMPEELRPLRDALSQLQLAYAREAPASVGADSPPQHAPPAASTTSPQGDEQPGAPGPAQSSGRLWVPGS